MIPLFHQQRTDTTYDKPTYKNNAHVTYGIFLCNKVDKATLTKGIDHKSRCMSIISLFKT